MKYEWLEDDLNPRFTSVATSISSAGTTLTISNSGYVNTYDVLFNVTSDEKYLATAGTGTSITITRAWGGTTATSAVSGQTILIMGSAFEEGLAESSVVVRSTKVSNQYNFTQIFRKKIEVTGTLDASKLYGGPDRQYQRKKKGIELMRDFETAFWFGDRAQTQLGSGHYTRSLRGIDTWISTNSTTSIGTMTESEFETAIRGPFRYGSNQKYLFASPLTVSVISQWAQGKLQMVPKDKTYGK